MSKKKFHIRVPVGGVHLVEKVSGEIVSYGDIQLGIHRTEHRGYRRKWDYVLTDIATGLLIKSFSRKRDAMASINDPVTQEFLDKAYKQEWHKRAVIEMTKFKEETVQ